MNKYLQAKEEDLSKAIDFFKQDIASLRAGRVNPAILDKVQVNAYDAKSPLNGMASITVIDGRSLMVSPWDKNIIKEVEKGITEANLGVSVANEGDKLRLTVPMMTEEDRFKIVKQLSEKAEKARITVRQIRDDIKEQVATAEKDKEISEDEKFRFLKELEEEISKTNNTIKEIRDKKEEEIMKV